MAQRMIKWLLVWVLTLSASTAWGAGFAIYDNSSRSTSLCSAVVAQGNDPSAVFFNPAAITQLEGTQTLLGANTYTATYNVAWENGEKEKLDNKVWILPHLYVSHQINDQLWLGVGYFTPFGLGTKYRENWTGRYNSYESVIQSMELNPNFVFKLDNRLSLAVGFSVARTEIPTLKLKIRPKTLAVNGIMQQTGMDEANAEGLYQYKYAAVYDNLPDIDQDADVADNGVRFNLGLFYKVSRSLNLGLHYRSGVNNKLRGDVTYKNVPADFSSQVYDTTVKAHMQLPDSVVVGASWQATDRLNVEFDFQRTNWSRYENLTYTFANSLGTVTQAKNWKDVNCYRLGAEYQVSNMIDLRMGYLFDESPIPSNVVDFTLPTNDRHMGSIGLGFHLKNLTINCHYALIYLVKREIDKNAEINIPMDWELEDAYSHLIGMEVAYKF